MNTIFEKVAGPVVVNALGLLAIAILSGCSTSSSVQTPYTASQIEHQLLAEIALQRGEYLVSAQEYLSLAQKSDDPEFARRATELAYEYGFDAYALSSAERWIELEPDNLTAHSYLGRLFVMRNNLDQAYASLDLALDAPELRNDGDYVALAGDLAEIADPSRGLDIFQRFDAQYPGIPGINAAIANLAAESGDMNLAVASARKTLALAPDWTGTRLMLARFLLASGQPSAAFEQMAFALEMNPGLGMELEFVQLVALAGEHQDALERLSRLQNRYPDSPDLSRTRALVLLQSGDYVSAQAEFMALLTDAYFVNECFWYLGQIAYQEGDYLQAIRYFDRVNTGSWVLPARLSTSQAYLALGEPETALEIQSEFAQAYPKSEFDTLQPQAEILASLGRQDEALDAIDRALEYKPWDPELWLYRGGLLEQSGDFDKAIKSFRKAVELAPQNPTALNALGYTLAVATRDYDEALGYISLALELQPENPAIMDSMGWVLFRQGQIKEAQAWLEGAYAQFPDPEIAAHLGEVLWEQGDREAATQIWVEALQASPGNRVLNDTVNRFKQ